MPHNETENPKQQTKKKRGVKRTYDEMNGGFSIQQPIQYIPMPMHKFLLVDYCV